MLFQGTYTTAFYRAVRDLLHDEATGVPSADRRALDLRWTELELEEPAARSSRATAPVSWDP